MRTDTFAGARARMRKRIENAATLLREGRLSAPYRAPFDVVMRDAIVSLRRYSPSPSPTHLRPVLLVPPLMVTSQIYDIAPELSAVGFLSRHGVPTFVADFGAPEAQAGGLDRTLDDHVLAVSRCVDHLVAETGEDVHLVGYSQGGMFCYQTAAFRKSAGIASLVTFGAPVDLRRNAPFKLNEKLAERLINGVRRLIDRPLGGLRGLPGTMSSRGFKLMAPLQEIRHLAQLVGVLHDTEALARLEPKRRFLGGEGFTAWPGPALRAFIDQFVVENRMKQGGFVIAGKSVALADITNPICYVVGAHDDLALPDAVRAIRTAAPRAPSYPVHVDAGHFGLVVGRAALSVCWPTVVAWTAWLDGRGTRPDILDSAAEKSPREDPAGLARALVAGGAEAVWERMGAFGLRLGKAADAARWQAPRVLRRGLLDLGAGGAHASLSGELRARAHEMPHAVCFLFAGRAFTFREADQRVDAIARELLATGVAVSSRVAVLASAHPDTLSLVMALNRLGAVGVVVDPAWPASRLATFLAATGAGLSVVDPSRLDRVPSDEPVTDSGQLDEVALILPLRDGGTRAITNRRLAMAGLDLAIDARLTRADTVYCPPSLRAAGLAAGLAGALAGGARMQLGDRFGDGGTRRPPIWDELLNSGATIVLADDDLARELADAPLPERHPVRLVFGDALASEIAAALIDRLGTRTRFRTLAGL